MHTARRKLATFGLNDQVLDEFTPAVDKLLAQVSSKQRFEFVEELASPLPCEVLADLFCIPETQRPNFYRWSNAMTQFFGGATEGIEKDEAQADQGASELRKYFTQLLQEWRARPQNDFLSSLLQNQGALGLDDSELISQACILLVAGTVTTSDQICNVLHEILRRPKILEQIQGNPSLLEAAMEEATRLDPSVNFLFRLSKIDQQLEDKQIKAGDLVFISVHAVNPNESVITRGVKVKAAVGPFEIAGQKTPKPGVFWI